jgi:hypothetical protein
VAAGRCAGCGRRDASIRKIQAHVVQCPAYAALYRAEPERALDPVAEEARWLAAEGSDSARIDARDERLEKLRVRLAEQRLAQADRWRTPKGLLD